VVWWLESMASTCSYSTILWIVRASQLVSSLIRLRIPRLLSRRPPNGLRPSQAVLEPT